MHIVHCSSINPSTYKGSFINLSLFKGWRGAGAGIQTRAASDEAAHLTSLLHVQGEQ